MPTTFSPKAPYLELQEKFLAVWRNVGLQDIIPLVFDDPDEDDDTVPYAKGQLERDGEFRYAFGAVYKVKCVVEIRMVRGWGLRYLVEQGIHKIDKYGRSLSGLSEFRSTTAKINRDTSRFAGKEVELIPAAWELWYDVENQ